MWASGVSSNGVALSSARSVPKYPIQDDTHDNYRQKASSGTSHTNVGFSRIPMNASKMNAPCPAAMPGRFGCAWFLIHPLPEAGTRADRLRFSTFTAQALAQTLRALVVQSR